MPVSPARAGGQMRYGLIFLVVLIIAGCNQPQRATQRAPRSPISAWIMAGAMTGDPVWHKYIHFTGRPFVKTSKGWRSTGREITAADIAAAPCAVLRDQDRSEYDHKLGVIRLNDHAKYPVLLHEIQHCIDMRNGIKDRRELERRAMIAEVGQEVK